ncbi:A/G-specific adenine glycosylase [Mongoliitalea lutea]|uniref:A/G-specific adenine glycosylase n=1 Tax=Mongoliitalea lutea TaxID=849756 RepID=UPI0016797CEC|nr:A/G-specific adenine glycosylase [Mongoliitalea lutea]
MSTNAFAHNILQWFETNKRDLPWRNTKNPYIIWLSEIILQQTRVAQGLPYFEKFLANYPTVEDLAAAPSEEIMRLWQGLGYYSRARNLHFCAQQVVNEYGGSFPTSYKELLKLKGVGSYTAAAIASFAFDEPVAVVDGNVFRVLARYFGIATDIASHAGKKEFEVLANEVLPPSKAGSYNQAIMEFGALHCTPNKPNCDTCPLVRSCVAFTNNLVQDLPVKINKVKIKERYFQYYQITCGDQVIIRQRGPKDIWEGLFEFPLVETNQKEELQLTNKGILEDLEIIPTQVVHDSSQVFKHILSHQRIFANFVRFEFEKAHEEQLKQWAHAQNWQLVSNETFENLGKSRLILRYLNGEE